MRKSEALFDAITDVQDSILSRADARYEAKRAAHRRAVRRWSIRGIAAALILAVLGGALLRPDSSPLYRSAFTVAAAEYPKMARYPRTDMFSGYDRWREDRAAQSRPEGYADGLEDFFAAVMGEFLTGREGENKAFSPTNVYLALAMLAELSGGNSRTQVMDLLGYDSLEAMRAQVSDVWNANYMDDGKTVSVLGTSLWLNEDIEFEKEVMETLADTYYASSYQGKMGSEKFNKALRGWLDAHTGGLLGDAAKKISLDADTIMALASTIWLEAKWDSTFKESKTAPDVFHAPAGDRTADFMKGTKDGHYYWGDSFAAASLPLENVGAMWIVLPDEGIAPEALLEDGETLEFLRAGSDWENSKYLEINISLPKFDITAENDLIAGLKDLGVTDVFDWRTADFAPMLGERESEYLPYVNAAQHDVRVTIDEEGVAAVAYTMLSFRAGAMAPPDDEVDFVVDRPFLFVITGEDGVPLFAGVVNEP